MTALALLILAAGLRPSRRPRTRDTGATTYWYHGQPISRAEYRALGGDS